MKRYSRVFKPMIVLIIIFLASPSISKAQVKQVLMNNRIPDVNIKEIVNYKSKSAKITDFKGKLLILDFWGTYCAPCVAMFPKEDSLEKHFEGKVQFLPITVEPEKKVTTFLKNMFKIRGVKPISVVNDTLFNQLFQYAGLPYYVWISSEGKVLATTGPEEITSANIEAMLAGKPTSFVNRNDISRRKIDYEKSFFVINHNFKFQDTSVKREEINRKNIISYSIAGKYSPNTEGRFYFDTLRFGAINLSVDRLYRFYYEVNYYKFPVQGAFTSKRNFAFEIKNEQLLKRITVPGSIKGGTKEMTTWAINNAVSYEIIYPPGLTWKQKMQLVKQDLDRYFGQPMGFEEHVEKRIDSNVVVLKRTDDIPITTKGQEATEQHDRYSYSQHNMPLSHLIGVLNGYFFQNKEISVVDKTGLKTNVDLVLSCDMANLDSVNAALTKYGLKFSQERTPIDVLVFSEKNNR